MSPFVEQDEAVGEPGKSCQTVPSQYISLLITRLPVENLISPTLPVVKLVPGEFVQSALTRLMIKEVKINKTIVCSLIGGLHSMLYPYFRASWCEIKSEKLADRTLLKFKV